MYSFRFYCLYGKEDHRFDSKYKILKINLARFAVRQLQLYSHIGEVIYYHSEHTRENDEVARGLTNPDSITRRTEVPPRIYEELKRWLIKRLDDRLTARQVFEEHKKVWFEGCTKNTKHSKDNSLLLKHVRYYEYQRKKIFGTYTKMHW